MRVCWYTIIFLVFLASAVRGDEPVSPPAFVPVTQSVATEPSFTSTVPPSPESTATPTRFQTATEAPTATVTATETPEASPTPIPSTVTLTVGDTQTLSPTRTSTETPAQTPSPTFSLTASPTLEAKGLTATPVIKAGQTCASLPQLKAALRSLQAEREIGDLDGQQFKVTERWQLTYREPDECLFQVFDAAGLLIRSKYYRGNVISVVAGSFRQQIQRPAPVAWDRLMDFLELQADPKDVKDYRELLPGLWVPNCIDTFDSSSKQVQRRTIVQFVVNEEVSGTFMTMGR